MRSRYPIAFSFDDNIIVAAQVALASLLSRAPDQVYYDIYLTYSRDTLKSENREKIESLVGSYPKHRFQAIDVGNAFQDCFEIRGIKIPTYYRLLLPDLLPDLDRIIYSDVDIIFPRSPHQALDRMNDNDLLCGVENVYRNSDEAYLKEIGVPQGEYINAGFIVMNLAKMRELSLCAKFLEMSRTDYIYQDQDILNITCQGSIQQLPLRYNVHAMHDYSNNQNQFADSVQKEIQEATVIHYAGIKPWNGVGCYYYDQWWEAYRHSPAFDFHYYLGRQKDAVRQVSQLQFEARSKWAQMKHLTKLQRIKSILKPSFWA